MKTTRVHHAAWWCGSGVASRTARAESGGTYNGVRDFGFTALALAGTAQLGDRQGFVELEDRVEHLATACLMRL